MSRGDYEAHQMQVERWEAQPVRPHIAMARRPRLSWFQRLLRRIGGRWIK